MEISLPITIIPTPVEKLYQQTINITGKISWTFGVGGLTKKQMTMLEEKFPLEDRIEIIDSDLLPKFSKGVWGKKEIDIFEKIVDDVCTKLKLQILSPEDYVNLALTTSRLFMDCSNNLYDQWIRALTFNEDPEISDIMYEIAYTLRNIRDESNLLFDKVSRILHTREKKFDKKITLDYTLITMLILRIYSITKNMLSKNIDRAKEETRYLAIETSRVLSIW